MREHIIPRYIAETEAARKELRVCETIYRILNFFAVLLRRIAADALCSCPFVCEGLFYNKNDNAPESEGPSFRGCALYIFLEILLFGLLCNATEALQRESGFFSCFFPFIGTTIYTAIFVFIIAFPYFRFSYGELARELMDLVSFYLCSPAVCIFDVWCLFRKPLGFDFVKSRWSEHPYSQSSAPTLEKPGLFVVKFVSFCAVCFVSVCFTAQLLALAVFNFDMLRVPAPEGLSWVAALQYRLCGAAFAHFDPNAFDFSAKYAVTCRLISAVLIVWSIFSYFMFTFTKNRILDRANIYPHAIRFETEEEAKERECAAREKKKKEREEERRLKELEKTGRVISASSHDYDERLHL